MRNQIFLLNLTFLSKTIPLIFGRILENRHILAGNIPIEFRFLHFDFFCKLFAFQYSNSKTFACVYASNYSSNASIGIASALSKHIFKASSLI